MTRRRTLLFTGLFLVALVVFMPLSLAMSLVGQGLSARAVTGTIWSGKLAEAQIGRLPLGDIAVRLKPFDFFRGRAGVSVQSVSGHGSITASGKDFAASNVTVDLDGSRLFVPLAVNRLNLTNVSAAFASGRCIRGEGRVRASFSGNVGGLSLAQGMSGFARCEGAALRLPLVSQSAMERLNLYIQGDGGYRAEFYVQSTDAALAAKLTAAGFAPAPGGFVLRMAGKL
jgi:general secretion pathway protein N